MNPPLLPFARRWPASRTGSWYAGKRQRSGLPGWLVWDFLSPGAARRDYEPEPVG